MSTYLREVSALKLRALCIAAHVLVASVMWIWHIDPALRERERSQREIEDLQRDEGIHDKVRTELTHIQREVRALRGELRAMHQPDEGEIQENGSYTHIESMAAQSGLRIRSFERAMRGFISPSERGLSKVVLEGTFPNLVRFAEVIAAAPTAQRLDSFVASVAEDMPETISISVTLSDGVATPYQMSPCAESFK